MTDYLDGAVARATGQVTRLGEILDLFCDLFYESFVLLVAMQSRFFPPWVLLLYLFREFWATSIRRYMRGQARPSPAAWLGKLKTNFIMWGFLPTFLALGGVFPPCEPELSVAGRVMVDIGLFSATSAAGVYPRLRQRHTTAQPPITGRLKGRLPACVALTPAPDPSPASFGTSPALARAACPPAGFLAGLSMRRPLRASGGQRPATASGLSRRATCWRARLPDHDRRGRGHARINDGAAANEGALWDVPLAAIFETGASTVT